MRLSKGGVAVIYVGETAQVTHCMDSELDKAAQRPLMRMGVPSDLFVRFYFLSDIPTFLNSFSGCQNSARLRNSIHST